jgi:hypothetical protein
MASTELKKQGNMALVGTVASIAGGIASIFVLPGFLFINWIVAIILFVVAGGMFKKVLKNFAETGRRF